MATTDTKVEERSLGEIVEEVSTKASLLVREEIELAKAEVTGKVTKFVRGAVVLAIAGVFAVFGLVYLLHGLAWFLTDLLDQDVWVGFALVTALLFALAAIAGVIGVRWLKRGRRPLPDEAIHQAQLTREAIGEAIER
jgi:uncharacterized membrane protein YqjE